MWINSKRGDILVFKSDELDNKRLVKRLIGLPGETVEIKRDGSIYIDGEKSSRSHMLQAPREKIKYLLYLRVSTFFLGDNRPISYDARYWNEPYISEDKAIGKVEFRFFR